MQSLHFSYKKNHNRSHIPSIGLVLVLLVSFVSCTSSCKDLERISLLQFLTGLSQDAGLTKLWQSTDICKWQGITCNQNGTVTAVSLPYRGLEGHISQSLGNLTNLQHLNLSYNSLSGGLPLGLVSSSSIIVVDVSFNLLSGDLHELPSSTSGQPLQVLNISSNLFTGQFTSTTWKGMHNLIALTASNNSFTGQIPSHLCNISPSFAVLELCYNKISGSIPPELGNCSAIKVLKAGHNNLSGTLPDELFNATTLEYLSFSSNGLHGTLDGTHIAKLTNLVILDLGENKFSGKIPYSIGQLKRLQELHLDFNNMYGELPSTLSNCTDLIVIKLRSNSFTGELAKDSSLAKSWQEDGTDCCKWEGVTCNGNKTVIQVSLPSRGLKGRIAPSLGNLTGLQHLNLSYNLLYGGLPQELVSSSSMVVLDVSFNQLNGDLHELSSSTSVHYNKLGGSVPSGLGNCSILRVLKADHNNLKGILPNELFNANSLEYLSFSSNNLQGVLDGKHIFKLSNLVILDLGENNFTGRIPDTIGQLRRLQEIDLDFNNMYGELPSSLSNCTDLIMINLRNNGFSGELAKVNFSNLENLKTLDLAWNNFIGTIPESIYSCVKLTALRLSYNNLHGQLSNGIGNLKSLSFLSLVDNNLTDITNALHILRGSKSLTTLLIGSNFMNETMPGDDSIDGFENLQVLAIQNCQLSGAIPLWMSKLGNLEMLFLDGNQLNGSIPTWISTLNYLFYVDISNNSLTGEISHELMNMPMLTSENTTAHLDPMIFDLPVYDGPSRQYRIPIALPKVIDLSSNHFTGVIPAEIGQLKALVTLDVSFNNLTGPIPPSICNLTNLQVLDLSSNSLTGEIPAALENLHFLSQFNISNNNLEGPIPTGGQFSTFQNSSFGGNPNLCGPMLSKNCRLAAEAIPETNVHTDLCGGKVIFAIAFGVFVGVGVLYDQVVLSRYFG
ncbi:hypothetical protein U9M48_025687 [Paspalum notatum var. saurae]|uniref:Leucine-rich repeat-containing N-terminal plant-type domain-containing protein n=1 Tax=Paspalum notatum var. saurae TaxID=547442 RepID=A0AAQ3WY69_PASNO